VVLVTLLVAPAWPQSSTTTVSGTVRDRTQAVIAKAAVALTNTATGVISRTTTNEAGFYIFAA
jgi:Carboxypeptidase regulatory-like domain